jgi:hypothetical protein
LTAGLSEPKPDPVVVSRIVAVARDEAEKARSSHGLGWLRIFATVCIMAVVGGLVYHQTRTGLITQESAVRLRKDDFPQTLSTGPSDTVVPSADQGKARGRTDTKVIPGAISEESEPLAAPPYAPAPTQPSGVGSSELAESTSGDLGRLADKGEGRTRIVDEDANQSALSPPVSAVPFMEPQQDRKLQPAPAKVKAKSLSDTDWADEAESPPEETISRDEPRSGAAEAVQPRTVKEERSKKARPAPKPKAQAAPGAGTDTQTAGQAPGPDRETEALVQEARPQTALKGFEKRNEVDQAIPAGPAPVAGLDDSDSVRAAPAPPSDYIDSGDRGGGEAAVEQPGNAFSIMAEGAQPMAQSQGNRQQDDLDLGRQALAEGNYHQAMTIFKDLLKRVEKGHQDRPATLLGLAQAYEGLGSREAARYTYERLARESSEHRSLADEKIRELR